MYVFSDCWQSGDGFGNLYHVNSEPLHIRPNRMNLCKAIGGASTGPKGRGMGHCTGELHPSGSPKRHSSLLVASRASFHAPSACAKHSPIGFLTQSAEKYWSSVRSNKLLVRFHNCHNCLWPVLHSTLSGQKSRIARSPKTKFLNLHPLSAISLR